MPAIKNAFAPQPYAHVSLPGIHSGIESVTGTKTIDLGIGHNNFVPSLTLQASLAADANKASYLSWSYGTKLGTFVISAWKATAAGTTTLIAATAAVNVSFTAVADSSAGI
jgi:hypothetical protein